MGLGLLSLYLVILVLGLANTVGYHRLLTHRSFKTSGWVRGIVTILAAQYSGPPMQWVAVHRIHHTVSDTEGDPHTPAKGFWFAHSGWLCGTRNPLLCALFAASGFGLQGRFLVVDVLRVAGRYPPIWRTMTRDLQQERLMRLLDLPFAIPLCFAAQVAAAWWIGGAWGIAWLWAAHLVLNNATWIVNSACHTPRLGQQRFPVRDRSRNVTWLALLTHGESNHNTHHRYPRSARHGQPGELDTSWTVIRVLSWLGLASDVQLAPEPRPAAPTEAAPQHAEET